MRDLAARLSEGARARRTVLVDSRGELSAGGYGRGAHLDILLGYPKATGIEQAVRTLSPEVILLDEIGSRREAEAILGVLGCGVQTVATAHAATAEELAGAISEYIKLYGSAATHLKAKFPHLKIGAYGSCGYYAGVGSDNVPAANSSPRMEYFVECSHKFLAAARDNKWPLDFFSYHSYSAPAEALRQVRFADEHLSEYGFTADKCERIFNEWLPYVKHDKLNAAVARRLSRIPRGDGFSLLPGLSDAIGMKGSVHLDSYEQQAKKLHVMTQ